MQDFEYFEPRNVDEAVSLLVKYGEAAKIIAGGTDLILRMQSGTRKPRYIINMKAIPGLDYISCEDEIRIGATTTLHAIATSAELGQKCPLLADVARQFASITIAHMATIGGNLCNASPAADTASPLITLSAKAKITGPDGDRTVPLEEFFTGPGSTVMKQDEVLTEVQVPVMPAHARWAYIKHGIRSVSDLAIASVSVVALIEKGIFTDARIALGAVDPTPMRSRPVEDALKGKEANPQNIDKAALLVKEQCCPISDVRASAEYRIEMSYVLTRRALMSCVNSKVGG
jgi:carbon-monoxide dehydrogenase medium subunit